MKEQKLIYKKITNKKIYKKMITTIIVVLLVMVEMIMMTSFANFKMQKSFNNMEENKDVTFAFYQNDEEVVTMPTKDDGYDFNASKSFCENDATIKWDSIDWSISIKNLNKSKTKCNLYFVKAGKLRKILSSDTKGMWGYKDKIIKIVIETTKNIKEASASQIVHGPYDESEAKNSSIESYVVCNSKDANCIGYLQGEGGIKLNQDSAYLFSNFRNVTQIEGIENLYTSNVTYMNFMFAEMESLRSLNLSKFDTSSVIDMQRMFYGAKQLQSLNLSSFDTRNVINMNYMFAYASNLTKITYGSKFVHTLMCTLDSTFESCPANIPDKNVNSSWGSV